MVDFLSMCLAASYLNLLFGGYKWWLWCVIYDHDCHKPIQWERRACYLWHPVLCGPIVVLIVISICDYRGYYPLEFFCCSFSTTSLLCQVSMLRVAVLRECQRNNHVRRDHEGKLLFLILIVLAYELCSIFNYFYRANDLSICETILRFYRVNGVQTCETAFVFQFVELRSEI